MLLLRFMTYTGKVLVIHAFSGAHSLNLIARKSLS